MPCLVPPEGVEFVRRLHSKVQASVFLNERARMAQMNAYEYDPHRMLKCLWTELRVRARQRASETYIQQGISSEGCLG
jgi:hypothetical protein